MTQTREHTPTTLATDFRNEPSRSSVGREKDLSVPIVWSLQQPFQRNVQPGKLFSTEFTARSLLDVVLALQPEDTGGFYAYNGERIVW